MPDAQGRSTTSGYRPAISETDTARIARYVGFLALVAFGAGVLNLAMAAISSSTGLLAAGLTLVGTGTWLLWTRRRAPAKGNGWLVGQLVATSVVAITAIGVALPELLPVITAAMLIPVVVALPLVPAGTLRKLMLVVWGLCLVLAVLGEFAPRTSDVPLWAMSALRIEGITVTSGVLLVLLWQYRNRLSDSARELGGLVTLSRDLAETLDPRDIGERLARHLAEATHADTCIISSWDRSADHVVGFATYPAESIAAFGSAYALADFPETRRVLDVKQPTSLHVDDSGRRRQRGAHPSRAGADHAGHAAARRQGRDGRAHRALKERATLRGART